MDNNPDHYNPSVTQPAPWQDPDGAHYFSFQDLYKPKIQLVRRWTPVVVTGGLDASGNPLESGDGLLGGAVTSQDSPAPARLVDLDVYQQGVSTIYGFTLTITVGNAVIVGEMDRCSLNSPRFDRVLPTRGWNAWDCYGNAGFGGDTYASGIFKSILRVDPRTWPADSVSPFLAQLLARTTKDSNGNILLSIRMTLDDYRNVSWSEADFRIGRALGTIGPVSAGEPVECIAGRWLNGRAVAGGNPKASDPWYQPSFYDCPFQFAARDGGVNTIVIDLSNGLATYSPGGSPVDLGDVNVQVGDGSSGNIGPFQINDSLYSSLGGIIEMPVTAAQFAGRNAPVSIVISRTDIVQKPWWEDPTGFYFAADARAVLMSSEPGSAMSTWQTDIRVTQWGQPVANVQLGVEVVPVKNGIKGATVPWIAGYPGNTAQGDGALVASVTPTDANGVATVTLKVVKDPGYRTPELDGQLYFIVPYAPGSAPPDLMKQGVASEQMISCVAWSDYSINENPAWPEIQELMVPYSKLFPAMKNVIDLTDQHSFQVFATNPPWVTPGGPVYQPNTPYALPNGKQIQRGAIPYFLTRPVNDPRYMPVTRDLSPNRLVTVLYYCYNLQQQYPPNIPPSPTPPQGQNIS